MNLYAFKLFGITLYYGWFDTLTEAEASRSRLGRLCLRVDECKWWEPINKDGEGRQ